MLNLNKQLETIINHIHFFIFHEPPGEVTQRLINNLFYAFCGVLGSTSITFIFSIWAVRALGPAEYGKFNLIVSISGFLIIPIIFGLTNSASHYLARKINDRREIISSILLIFILLAALFGTTFLLNSDYFAHLFRVESHIFKWATVMALAMAASYLMQSIFRGLERFRSLAWLEIWSAITFAASISYVFLINKDFSYSGVTLSNALRWGIIAILGLPAVLSLIGRPTLRWLKETLFFGAYHVLMAFGGFFFLGMIDNVMMNYYLGYTAVGIYSAYYTIFSIFGGKVLATISNVLYPTASTYNNTAVLFRKIIRGLPKISIAVFIFIILAITVLFRIYGNAYPFSWILTILMAFNVVIYTAIVLLGNIIGSRGVYGTRFLAVATIAAGIINVLLNAALIPSFKLIGVMMATTIASAFLLYSYWRWLRVKSQEVVPSSDLA